MTPVAGVFPVICPGGEAGAFRDARMERDSAKHSAVVSADGLAATL
jgi:hypothetical protein